MQAKGPPFASTAPRRRWTYGSTTNSNVFLHNDYFYIALSSLVILSKQKNIVLYENKKNRNHIKNTIAIVSIFHGCHSDALKKEWTKLPKQSYNGGREEANKFDERQGLSLSPTRRLILSRDMSHLPLPDLSNAQQTHFIIVFNTNFISVNVIHSEFRHYMNVSYRKKNIRYNVLYAHLFSIKIKRSLESIHIFCDKISISPCSNLCGVSEAKYWYINTSVWVYEKWVHTRTVFSDQFP